MSLEEVLYAVYDTLKDDYNKPSDIFRNMIFLTKLMVFILIIAILVMLREVVTLIKCYIKLEKYEINEKRTWLVWSAMSYIIMTIICGI